MDNRDSPYDREQLSRMCRYLAKAGECYYIKFRENARSRLVGDIALYNGKIAIVICKEYQNRHLGRKAAAAIINRARQLGRTEVEAEIYSFDHQSRRMFRSLGFRQIAPERYRLSLQHQEG